MMEVLDPATNKWILADIDNNSIFRYRDSTSFLNFAQFREALYNDKLEFAPLSKDVRYDISGFKSKNDYAFGFIMERLHNKEELAKWYRRIFRNVLVEGDVYTASDKDVIHRKHPEYTFSDSLSFEHKYYEPTLSSYASQHSVTEHGLKKQTHNSYKSKRKE